MRIVGGTWRGRGLAAPSGATVRPTADRVRQALFDMLLHAPWGGRMDGVRVLDAFAGTGALGLEALSRGAAHATFMERDRTALAALRGNIAGLQAEDRARVIEGDALSPPRAAWACTLLFLDPPYGLELATRALAALDAGGWIAPGALVAVETGRDEAVPPDALAERVHGAARVSVWRWRA